MVEGQEFHGFQIVKLLFPKAEIALYSRNLSAGTEKRSHFDFAGLFCLFFVRFACKYNINS